MIRILLTILIVLLASTANAADRKKFVAVDSAGVVQDMATVKSNLSRIYQFEANPTIYEVPESLDVDILDRYDGVKVIRYSGTNKQRKLILLNHAISNITEKILALPVGNKSRLEYEAVKVELEAIQTELSK